MGKTTTLLVALIAPITYSFAQSILPQVLGTNGTFLSSSGYSVSYTTGQPASSTLISGTSIITQGFQQPNDAYTGLQTFATPTLNIQVFPNPTINEVNIVLNVTTTDNYTIQLRDLLGRLLQQRVTQLINGKSTFVFDVHQLPASMYFITIQSGSSDVVHTFKFNKIN